MRKMNRRGFALWRYALPVMAAFMLTAVAGCSVPGVFGSDDSPLPLPPPLEAGDDGVVPDNTGRKDDTETASAEGTEPARSDTAESPDAVGETPAEDGAYPELADVPEGTEATKAAERAPEAQTARESLASGLVADREQAKHTDEELRGGRVAPVAPPRPEAPAPSRPVPSQPSEAAAAPAPATPAPVASAPPRVVTPAPVAASAPARPTAVPLAPQAPRPVAAPAQTVPMANSSTFQPSRAQPLPADLAASLPPGVAQRYQETLRRPVTGAPSGLPVAPVIGGGVGAAYVSIPFASGSSSLSANDRRIIAQAANAARGGFSRIRVVGHASSTASSQSESARLMANWEVSQARATAVADELVRQGIDAARIVIEAVGDSQSAYAGGMDAEAAARRVDLYLE